MNDSEVFIMFVRVEREGTVRKILRMAQNIINFEGRVKKIKKDTNISVNHIFKRNFHREK
jgi:hypothetical protein